MLKKTNSIGIVFLSVLMIAFITAFIFRLGQKSVGIASWGEYDDCGWS